MADPPLSSAQRTLGVVELLEYVLPNLDLTDLVHAGRVCKLWHTVIEESRVLRQNRFLEPMLPKEWLHWDPCRCPAYTLLTKPLPPVDCKALCSTHPALAHLIRHCPWPAPDVIYFVNTSSRHLPQLIANYRLGKALLAQPPPRHVYVEIYGSSQTHKLNSDSVSTFEELLSLMSGACPELSEHYVPGRRWIHAFVTILGMVPARSDRVSLVKADTRKYEETMALRAAKRAKRPEELDIFSEGPLYLDKMFGG